MPKRLSTPLAGLCLLVAALVLSSCASHDRRLVYSSAFDAGIGAFTVQWTGQGRLSTSLDPSRRAPSGAPCLRTVCSDRSTGSVGVTLNPRRNRVWRLRLWGGSELEHGRASLNLQCWDADGKQIDWVSLGTLPSGSDLRQLVTVAVIPEAAVRVNLIVLHKEAKGTTWIGDVRVETFELSSTQMSASRAGQPVRWGATGVLKSNEPTLRDTGAKLLAAAGVRHTRAGIDWRKAEPEKGRYDFSALDDCLDELSHYGITADVVFVHGTPTWASGKCGATDLPEERRAKGEKYVKRAFWAPRDWVDWERFITALVTHFRGRVAAWEILNEPDLWTEGFCGAYEEYRQYLRIAFEAAKCADPKCRVLAAAFVHGQWLPDLLRDDMSAYFDGICIHPYHSTGVGVLSKARRLQALLLAAGVSKPLWVTEVGFQSGGWQAGPGVTSDEHQKAEAGKQALTGLRSVSDFVCWYTAIERGSMYGLLRDEGGFYRPMPVYYAYGDLTQCLPARADVPVRARVDVRRDQGEERAWRVRLSVENGTDVPVRVTFWPVGFVADLGFTLEQVRELDWAGTLGPGERHETTAILRPGSDVRGRYPVGLAVLTPQGNDLELRTVSAE